MISIVLEKHKKLFQAVTPKNQVFDSPGKIKSPQPPLNELTVVSSKCVCVHFTATESIFAPNPFTDRYSYPP